MSSNVYPVEPLQVYQVQLKQLYECLFKWRAYSTALLELKEEIRMLREASEETKKYVDIEREREWRQRYRPYNKEERII